MYSQDYATCSKCNVRQPKSDMLQAVSAPPTIPGRPGVLVRRGADLYRGPDTPSIPPSKTAIDIAEASPWTCRAEERCVLHRIQGAVSDSLAKDELLAEAWGVIANANGGHWQAPTSAGPKFDAEWMLAAEAWRDKWHATFTPFMTTEEATLVKESQEHEMAKMFPCIFVAEPRVTAPRITKPDRPKAKRKKK